MLLPLQVQVLTLWASARRRLDALGRRLGDERGETTAGVILLVLLAIAAVAVAGIIVDRLMNRAEQIPE